MATPISKTHCVKCGKEKCTLRCAGCLQEFCFNHLAEHRQELNKQLDEIQFNRDLFRQSLTEQTKEPNSHPLIQQIDKWKCDSIEIIEKTAEEAKQLLVKHITGHFDQIEIKLNKLTNQLREIREENDFNEINLHQFQEELTRLTTELTKPPIISIRQDSSSFINKIYVDVSEDLLKPKVTNVDTIKSGKLLGRFAQSHNNVPIEITLEHAIFGGKLNPLTWIEDDAFYYLFGNRYWYYIRNGNTYEVIQCDTGYHKLLPIK